MMLWTDTYFNVYNGVVPLVRGNTIHAGTTTVFWKIISFLVAFFNFIQCYKILYSSFEKKEENRKHLKMHRILLYLNKVSFLSLIIFNFAAYVKYANKKKILWYSPGDNTRNWTTMKQPKLKLLIVLSLAMLYFPAFRRKYQLFPIQSNKMKDSFIWIQFFDWIGHNDKQYIQSYYFCQSWYCCSGV